MPSGPLQGVSCVCRSRTLTHKAGFPPTSFRAAATFGKREHGHGSSEVHSTWPPAQELRIRISGVSFPTCCLGSHYSNHSRVSQSTSHRQQLPQGPGPAPPTQPSPSPQKSTAWIICLPVISGKELSQSVILSRKCWHWTTGRKYFVHINQILSASCPRHSPGDRERKPMRSQKHSGVTLGLTAPLHQPHLPSPARLREPRRPSSQPLSVCAQLHPGSTKVFASQKLNQSVLKLLNKLPPGTQGIHVSTQSDR